MSPGCEMVTDRSVIMVVLVMSRASTSNENDRDGDGDGDSNANSRAYSTMVAVRVRELSSQGTLDGKFHITVDTRKMDSRTSLKIISP